MLYAQFNPDQVVALMEVFKKEAGVEVAEAQRQVTDCHRTIEEQRKVINLLEEIIAKKNPKIHKAYKSLHEWNRYKPENRSKLGLD